MVQNQGIFIFFYLHPKEAFSSGFLCAFQLNFAIASVVSVFDMKLLIVNVIVHWC